MAATQVPVGVCRGADGRLALRRITAAPVGPLRPKAAHRIKSLAYERAGGPGSLQEDHRSSASSTPPAAAGAAATAAALLLLTAAPSPCLAGAGDPTLAPSQQMMTERPPQPASDLADASPAPSLVASPLTSDAAAELTAAVTQQVVSAALAPGDGAAGPAVPPGAAMVAGSEAAGSVVVEGIMAVVEEGIQGANLVDTALPAVSAGVPASWLSTTPLCGAWQAYCLSLARAPLATKVATGVVGALLGDLIAQGLAQYGGPAPFRYDAARAARLAAFSAVIGTPLSHYWYLLLDGWVSPGDPTAPAAVAAKVVLDQGLQTPVGMALFFASLKALEGRPGDAVPEVQAKLAPALMSNWRLWPLAQLINFTVVPLDMRILYVNVISIAWTAYISNMACGDAGADTAPVTPVTPALARQASGGSMAVSVPPSPRWAGGAVTPAAAQAPGRARGDARTAEPVGAGGRRGGASSGSGRVGLAEAPPPTSQRRKSGTLLM